MNQRRQPSLLWVEIDPNMRTPEGFVPAFASELPPLTKVGDLVTVVEVEGGFYAVARVASIRGSIAYLEVAWNTIEPFISTSIGAGTAANKTPVVMEPKAA